VLAWETDDAGIVKRAASMPVSQSMTVVSKYDAACMAIVSLPLA
jgi:hypothetical protein